MHRKKDLTKAKYSEWQASLWGACIIAFGLGTLLSNYIGSYAFFLILVGSFIHGWGMYKIHQRNKER
jgi:hypothetical protein